MAARVESDGDGVASAQLTIHYPEIDWHFARQTYGWAGLQYQSWARGYVYNNSPEGKRVVLFSDGVLELRFNHEPLFGMDLYGFRRAPPVLKLNPGENVLDVRLVRDNRAMGTQMPPQIAVKLEIREQKSLGCIVESSLIFPELFEGKLATSFASAVVRNNGEHWFTITRCWISEETPDTNLDQLILETRIKLRAKLLSQNPIHIGPGQSRPIALRLEPVGYHVIPNFNLTCKLELTASNDSVQYLSVPVHLSSKSKREPLKITFPHPSGVVSYAIMRPPQPTNSTRSLPVLLNLHGAGVEADSQQARHQLDGAGEIDAWILFPTGMTPWAGDDWHTWGTADVKAAIEAIPRWMDDINWTGPGIFTDRWVVSGHSNGGQGAWYLTSHYPDKVLAAAPVSGYSSIETYVPYSMWSYAEPLKSAVLEIARSSFRHENLAENIANIPILQQHGSQDDNVPPFHSRLMNFLLHLSGAQARYFEIPDKGHWYEGVMTTDPLRQFYRQHWDSRVPGGNTKLPAASIYPNSADMDSWNGLVVEQLQSPDKLGRLEITPKWDGKRLIWDLQTYNVRRLRLQGYHRFNCQDEFTLNIDGSDVDIKNMSSTQTIVRSPNCIWEMEDDSTWHHIGSRYGKQRGFLDAILQNPGPFQIVPLANASMPLAMQISRNFLQYFGADSEVLEALDYPSARSSASNLILLARQFDPIPPSQLEGFPLQISKHGIRIRQAFRKREILIPFSAGLGAIFLRPLDNERLELIVWGWDPLGLYRASRLIPTLTGVGQPDFILLGDKSGWMGHAGALALGFFDYSWNISDASYVPF